MGRVSSCSNGTKVQALAIGPSEIWIFGSESDQEEYFSSTDDISNNERQQIRKPRCRKRQEYQNEDECDGDKIHQTNLIATSRNIVFRRIYRYTTPITPQIDTDEPHSFATTSANEPSRKQSSQKNQISQPSTLFEPHVLPPRSARRRGVG